MLVLQNISRRMQVFNMDHAVFQEEGKEHGYKLIHTTVVEHARNGVMSARKLPRLVPSSITFADGETKTLPNEVLLCESIKRATRPGGELRVLQQTDDEAPEKAAPEDPKPEAPAEPQQPKVAKRATKDA